MAESNNADAKEVEYYSALVNAWMSTRMEFDKTLIGLSSAGIGLLVSLLSALGVKGPVSLVLYVIALFAFLISILAVMISFKGNSSHIEDILKKNKEGDDALLVLADKVASTTFLVGIAAAVLLGVVSGYYSIKEQGELEMAKRSEDSTPYHQVGVSEEKRSLTGAARLKPEKAPVERLPSSDSTNPPEGSDAGPGPSNESTLNE